MKSNESTKVMENYDTMENEKEQNMEQDSIYKIILTLFLAHSNTISYHR